MFEQKPIRLVWGTPAVTGGRWHFALVNLKVIPRSRGARNAAPAPAQLEAYSRHFLHISVRGAGFWLLLSALAVYLLGAVVVLQRLRSGDPHMRAGYLDVVLPNRWNDLERMRGAALIDQARELISRKKPSEGFALLRQGLARDPGDFSARLDVAKVYVANGLKPQAIKLLRGGLDFGYPGRAYLEVFVALLSESDQPDLKCEILSLAREKFDAAPGPERSRTDAAWLDNQLAKALREAGRGAEAVAYLQTRQPARDPAVRRFVAAHLLVENRATEAADAARRWSEDFPRDSEPLCILAESLRVSGDLAGMDAALARLERLDPARPDALLYSVVQNHLAGRETESNRKLDALIFRHGSTPSFYAIVCTSFLGFRHLAGLDRAEKEMRERGFSPRPVLWARVKLAEQSRDWSGLLRWMETLRKSSGPPFDANEQAYSDTMERLALACIDGASGTQASLVEIVRAHPGSLVLYRTLLEALLHAGRSGTAREVLVLAEGPYPDSRSLRDLRSKIETALLASTPVSAPDRRDPPLASWDAFVAAVDARVDGGDAAGALALFAELRRARPGWGEEAAARIDALELPLRARADDPLRLQVLLRSALARDLSAPDSLLALAQALHAEGRADNAAFIVREILRHSPRHQGTLDQLALWFPPQDGAPAGL